MFTDSIADMLTRIRNAAMARRSVVSMPYSKMKHGMADILAANDFIAGVKVAEAGGFKTLELTLSGDPETITSLVRVSKPGRRIRRHPIRAWWPRYCDPLDLQRSHDGSRRSQTTPRWRVNL